MDEKLRINIFPQGEKTAELICNWCGEPHAVEPEYREERLKRGAEQILELRKQGAKIDIKPEQTWTCGKCMLVLNGLSPDAMKTDCHDHEVPEEKYDR